MPVAKKPAAKSVAAKKEEVVAHKHEDLLKEIAELKKALADVKAESVALKGQCHSCCGDLAALKKEVEDLKAKPAGSKDERVDLLIKILNESAEHPTRKLLRAKRDLLK